MTIITTPQPQSHAPARSARKEAAFRMLEILAAIIPENQLSATRTCVELAGTKTFWSKPQDESLPLFLVGNQGSQSKLFLLSRDRSALFTYYGARNKFRRGEVIYNAEEIVAALPRYALNENAVEPATEAQMKVLKKHFTFSLCAPLTRIAASRVLDCLVLEGNLPQLLQDTQKWREEISVAAQQQALALSQ